MVEEESWVFTKFIVATFSSDVVTQILITFLKTVLPLLFQYLLDYQVASAAQIRFQP